MRSTRRLRSLVVGLMVVSGLSSVGVASASAALPEMVNKEGKALVKSKFTGTVPRSSMAFVIKGWGSVTCAGGAKSSGEVTGLQSSHSAWTWTECGVEGHTYQTEGAKKGEIVIPELNSQLVYEVYEKGTVLEPALLLTFAKEIKLGVIAESEHIKGSLLVPMPRGEEFRTHFSIEAKQNEAKQEGTGEYEETRGGELKKASLVTTVEGAKKLTNASTALAFNEERTFEEEFKINW